MAFNFEQFGTIVEEPKKKVGGFDFESFGTEVAPPTKEKKQGFFKGLAQDIAQPFGRVAATALDRPVSVLGREAQPLRSPIKEGGIFTPPGQRFGLQQPIDLKALGDVAKVGLEIGTTISAPGQAKVATKLAQTGITRLGEKTAQKNLGRIVEMVSPKLTAKELAEEAAKRGTTKTGILGRIKTVVSPRVQEMAQTIQKYVPEFKLNKTIAENLNATRKAVGSIAQTLKDDVIKSGKDKIYSFKELGSKMNKVAKPITIKSDNVLSRQFDLAKEAALEVARSKGGKISNLLDARKAFDDLVEREFPNLYDNASKPMRSAITSMRNVMNDFIADNVQDVAFKESLKIQSNLFRAIDNMAEKIASGGAKEIGTTALKRFGQRHPVISKTGRYIGAGLVGGVVGQRILGE